MTHRPTDRFENWFITSLQTDINDTTTSFRLNKALNVHQGRLVIDPYDETKREIVKVTSVDGNLVYVERGNDNTAPEYHNEGTIVAMHVFAADMNDLYADFAGVVDATDAANQAASDASSAASDASSAASAATTATGLANTATSNANAATTAASNAASAAKSAASSATTAATNAQTAADNAQGIVDDVAGAVDDGILPIHTDKVNNRVGINKVPTQGALDVDGDIYSNGEKVGIEGGDIEEADYTGSNGYIRYKNGIQVAWVEQYNNSAWTLWQNGIYYRDFSVPNWKKPFVQVLTYNAITDSEQIWCTINGVSNTTAGNVRMFRPSNSGQAGTVTVTGMGRWK